MIIIGLDPGLATTGYAIVTKLRGKSLIAEDWGIIETQNKKSLAERLMILAADLSKLLKQYHPELAIVESIYFAKNKKTVIAVAHARGVILLTLKKQKVKILELTPLQVKLQLTGHGTAPKSQVQFMVKKLLHLKTIPHPDDAADALALAMCGPTRYET